MYCFLVCLLRNIVETPFQVKINRYKMYVIYPHIQRIILSKRTPFILRNILTLLSRIQGKKSEILFSVKRLFKIFLSSTISEKYDISIEIYHSLSTRFVTHNFGVKSASRLELNINHQYLLLLFIIIIITFSYL